MHPTLSEHLHPGCVEAIQALEDCHQANPLKKFIGSCNDFKTALDQCLRDEFLVKRELNAQQSKAEKDRLKERLARGGML